MRWDEMKWIIIKCLKRERQKWWYKNKGKSPGEKWGKSRNEGKEKKGKLKNKLGKEIKGNEKES